MSSGASTDPDFGFLHKCGVWGGYFWVCFCPDGDGRDGSGLCIAREEDVYLVSKKTYLSTHCSW